MRKKSVEKRICMKKQYFSTVLIINIITSSLQAAQDRTPGAFSALPTINILVKTAVEKALQKQREEHERHLKEEQEHCAHKQLQLVAAHTKKEHASLTAVSFLLAYVMEEFRLHVPEPARPDDEQAMSYLLRAFQKTRLAFTAIAHTSNQVLQDPSLHVRALDEIQDIQQLFGQQLLASLNNNNHADGISPTDSAIPSTATEEEE